MKIKFRTSTVEGGQGTIFYQVIHNRVARQVKTGYRIYESEWDGSLSEIAMPRFDETRKAYLSEIRDKVTNDSRKFQRIIAALERQGTPYNADDVVSAFISATTQDTFFGFMEEVIMSIRN